MSTQRFPRNGRTIREAAEITGLSERSIRRWTSEPREVWINRAHERQAKIREMYATGMTMRDIAAKLSISVGTVHYAIRRAPGANDQAS